jgi:hypothetical protein
VPVDPKTLPHDAPTLQKIVVDLTAQLDRTERLLRQLLQAKTGRKSEQLSREQLALFAAEVGLICRSKKHRKKIQTKIHRRVPREMVAPSRADASRCRAI